MRNGVKIYTGLQIGGNSENNKIKNGGGGELGKVRNFLNPTPSTPKLHQIRRINFTSVDTNVILDISLRIAPLGRN